MEDEGYTSPAEELESHKDNIGPGNLDDRWARKSPYYDRFIQRWDEIRLHKDPGVEHRRFLSSNNVPSGVDLSDFIWRLAPVIDDDRVPGSLATLKSLTEEPKYILMSEFISHIFHLLNGRESLSFIFCSEEMHLFKRNPVVLVKGLSPTTLDNYSKNFIECGGRFRKLQMLANGQSRADGEGNRSTIFATFQAALGDYLKVYQIILMINSNSMTTFTKLHTFIQPYHVQFHVLENVAEVALHKTPVTLISELNRMIFAQETPYVQDLLRTFFVLVASTYMRYISDWIFRGELASPMDFHIKSQAESTAKDRRFWTRQFVQFQTVPLFIEGSADLIFETGKAIHLFNLIKNIDYSESISPLFSYDTNQVLKQCESFEGLPQLALKWDTKLNEFLSQNEHLIQGIKESIANVLSNSSKEVELDFNIVNSVRESYLKAAAESKLHNLARKRSQQRRFRLSLQEQVEEAKLLKACEKERDDLESKSNAMYNANKERQYDEEKIKFRKKYFPTTEPDRRGRKYMSLNLEELNLETMQKITDAGTLTSSNAAGIQNEAQMHTSVSNNKNNGNNAIVEDVNLGQESQFTELTRGLDEVDSFKNNGIKKDTKPPRTPTTRKRNYNKKIAKTIEEILSFKQCTSIVHATPGAIDSPQILLEDEEEKLDPEKFILTKAEPIPELNFEIFNQKPNAQTSVQSVDDRVSSKNLHVDASFLNTLFTQSISIPLQAQHKMVNTALLYYFVKEKQLFHHLSAMNEFLLLQNGVFGHALTSLLIDEMRKSPVGSLTEFVKKTGSLQIVLNDALSIAYFNQDLDPLSENLSFVLAHENDTMMKELREIECGKGSAHISSEFQFLNALRLTYVVDWPLNIILTEDMIHHYESLFGIFMQLSRSEQLLNQIFLLLKSKRSRSDQLFRLQMYRHKLLHFVRTLRVYMNMEIVHGDWVEFCLSLEALDTLQSIYDSIVRYVRDLASSCFLSFSSKGAGVLKLILRHLAIVDSFCSQVMKECGNPEFNWDRGSTIKDSEFMLLRRKHAATWQFHKMFLSTLYKASGKEMFRKIDSFLEYHDLNCFYELQLNAEKESAGLSARSLRSSTSIHVE